MSNSVLNSNASGLRSAAHKEQIMNRPVPERNTARIKSDEEEDDNDEEDDEEAEEEEVEDQVENENENEYEEDEEDEMEEEEEAITTQSHMDTLYENEFSLNEQTSNHQSPLTFTKKQALPHTASCKLITLYSHSEINVLIV